MAYEDLTLEERQALQQSLLAPPPAMFAQAQSFEVDPLTRAQAAAGLLGPQGRFFEQMARQQDEAKLESAAADMARELMSVTPLEMGKKAQELAARDPKAFATQTVQQALQLGSLARQEQKLAEQEAQQAKGLAMAQTIFDLPRQGFTQALKERAKADPDAFNTPEVQQAVSLREQEIREQQARRGQKRERKQESQLGSIQSGIATATPEALDEFEATNPQLVPKLRTQIDARRKEFSEIETELSQLPAYLIDEEKPPTRLHEVQKLKRKLENSLSPSMRKVPGLENRLRAVQLAKELQALRKSAPPEGQKPEMMSDAEMSASSELAALLGYKDEFAPVPDSTINLLVKDEVQLRGVEAYAPTQATKDHIERVWQAQPAQ